MPRSQRDIANVLSAVEAARAAGHDVAAFLPVVAPASVAYKRQDVYYGSEEEYVVAVAEALREEYRTIIDAGLMLQVDDAHLPMMYDNIVDPGTPEDFRRWARLRIDALNHALDGIPTDRSRYHICWGSFNSPHVGDVPFREIADLVLSVNVGGYAIEMANPRHEHEWRVWEDLELPDDKVLIPGVIAHTTNVVEHPELVAERLVRLAGLVGPRAGDRRHRLRLRPGPLRPAGAPHDHVGQAPGARRRRSASPAPRCGDGGALTSGRPLEPVGT